MQTNTLLLSHVLAIPLLGGGVVIAQENVTPARQVSQSGPGIQNNEIQEVVVTAQKRSERDIDVPLAITSASGVQLAALGIDTPADLATITPGFTYRPSAYGNPVYTIRGVGFFEESYGISPDVSVYVDQVPLPYSAETQGASFDVERVEVLKGPQGTLFGQNVTGGAINYIANKPTAKFSTGIEADYGNYSASKLYGYISGPIADTLKARLALEHDGRGNWQKTYTSLDPAGFAVPDTSNPFKLGQQDIWKGRLLIDWEPSDAVSFEANLNAWSDRSDDQALQYLGYSPITPGAGGDIRLTPYLLSYPVAPQNARYAAWDPNHSLRRNDHFYQASLSANTRLNDQVTLTSITAYSHFKAREPVDQDGTQYTDLFIVNSGQITSITEELRLAGALASGQLRWMAGGNYEHDHTFDHQLFNFSGGGTNDVFNAPPIPGLIGGGQSYYYTGGIQHLDQKVNTGGLFGSLDYQPVDAVTLYASSRYTITRRHGSACLNDNGDGTFSRAFSVVANLAELIKTGTSADNQIPPGACFTESAVTGIPVASVERDLDEHNVSWRLGGEWKPGPDWMLYANVTKGFKSGTFANITLVTDSQETPVPQESVVNYEVGFKAAVLNRSVVASGALFHMNYQNKQLAGSVLTPPFGYLPTIISIPTSTVDGGELDLTWRMFSALTVRTGVSYLDSKVTSHVFQPDVHYGSPNLIDLHGQAFPGTSKWQGNFDADYGIPVSDNWTGFLGASVYLQSKARSHFSTPDLDVVPGYGLLNVRAGFEAHDGAFRVELWGRNVTNKFYVLTVSNIQDAIVRSVGMPATYGISMSARY